MPRDNLTPRAHPRGPDLRRAISRQAWLTNRAGNALRRPTFIGAVSIATFVLALTSLITAPKLQRQAPAQIPVAVRPDTLQLAGNVALGRVQLVQAESALAASRLAAAAAAAEMQAYLADTVARAVSAAQDSMSERVSAIETQLTRAEQAPLPSSYRALAGLPEMRADPRVRALLDTLSEIEREREGYGSAGGVDPIFVALTSRANEVGRAIQAIANEKRAAARTALESLPTTQPVVALPAVDTTTHVEKIDSLRTAIQQFSAELTRRRQQSVALDAAEARARARANAVAPPLALLASAFVLSWVVGFGVAFIGELRTPRVSNASEVERFLGVRVLSTVETAMPTVDRGRREADRAAPRYFDPNAEDYQLTYLGLATDHPSLLMATVTGDDPAIASVVACNLAAIAAHEARNTLIIDMDPKHSASRALLARAEPGLADIAQRGASWPDVTTSARIGRDRTLDLVPYGRGSHQVPATQLAALIGESSPRLARYYDAIFLLAPATDVAGGIAAALPSPEVIYCAQPGITPLRKLREQLDRIRDTGGSIRGIVLWAVERPVLGAPQADVVHPGSNAQTPRTEVPVPS